MGLIAVLEQPEDVVTYGKHPAHQRFVTGSHFNSTRRLNLSRVHEIREALCSQTLAYDFEFQAERL